MLLASMDTAMWHDRSFRSDRFWKRSVETYKSVPVCIFLQRSENCEGYTSIKGAPNRTPSGRVEIKLVSFCIRLFGTAQVLVDDKEVRPPRSRKALWLLALLSLRQRVPTEREWLASIIWPDSDRSQALANLRTSLSELRAALGSEGHRLDTTGSQLVKLNLDGASVDVREFDQCVASGTRSDLEKAVALYSGPLLEGCSEEWASQERGAREQECLDALQILGETTHRSGDHRSAIRWFKQLVNLDPWSDRGHRGLMEALAADGDLNEALRVYRLFEERLRSESFSVPDSRTSSIYRKLRNQARDQGESSPAPLARPLGNIPHPLTELIGREDEKLEVSVLLRRSRLVTLSGLGGIGKTRLAIAVAAESSSTFADGCWLVPLDSIYDGDLVSRQICAVFGLGESADETWLQVAAKSLRSKCALIVLDNCEHILDATANVCTYLLQECPSLRILTTSREAIGITGETVCAVPALPVPEPGHLPKGLSTMRRVIAGYEGVQLFIDRATAANKRFELNADNVEAVADICQRLDGVPLALELAASHVRTLNVNQISAHLGNRLGFLRGTSRNATARHRTIHSTLDWSYELLTETERTLLSRLSLFSGGLNLEAAEKVCSGDGVEHQLVASLLGSLVEKSLVQFEDRRNRYKLLEVVRQYALEKLCESGTEPSIWLRLCDWIVLLVEEGEQHLKGTTPREWLSRTTEDMPNIRGVLARFIQEGDKQQIGLRIAGALTRYWSIRGDFREGREFLERTLELDSARLPTTYRAKALHGLALFASRQGQNQIAKAYHLESLEIRTRLGDQKGVAESYVSLGSVSHAQAEYEEAAEACEAALRIYSELGDKPNEARVLAHLGTIKVAQGDNPAARLRYEQSLVVSKQLGDALQIAWTLFSLGTLAAERSDETLAHACFEESRSRFLELGDRRGNAWVLKELGLLEYGEGRFRESREHLEESKDIFDDLGDHHGSAWCLLELGLLAEYEGERTKARSTLSEALSLFKAVNDLPSIGIATLRLGMLDRLDGDLQSAKLATQDSMKVFMEQNVRVGIVLALEELSMIALDQGLAEQAIRTWGVAAAIRNQIEYFHTRVQETQFQPRISEAKRTLGEELFTISIDWGNTRNWQEFVETMK